MNRRAMLGMLLPGLFSLALVVLAAGCGSGLQIAIPKHTVIAQVQRKFPVTRGGLLSVELSNPRVDFDGGRNKIIVDVDTTVRALGLLPAKGRASVEASLDYNAAKKAVTLKDITVRKLNIKGLPEGKQDEVIGKIGGIVTPLLNGISVYQFDQNNPLEKVAGAHLRGFRVTNESLIIKVGY